MITMKMNDADFSYQLKRYALAKKISFAKAIKQQGRLVAVNLAFQTQPFGAEKGKLLGEGAISGDLLPKKGTNKGIFKPLNKFWMDEAIRMKQYAPENFTRRFTTKDGRVWMSEEDQILISIGAMKQFHQSMRTEGGRRRTSKAGQGDRGIGRHGTANRGIVDKDKLGQYVTATHKKVGIAKAGWAHCAKQLGGSRGIPQWVTRHAGKRATGSVVDNSEATSEQYVTMTNQVPWIDKCLNAGQIQRALDIQKEKMTKAIEIALSKA